MIVKDSSEKLRINWILWRSSKNIFGFAFCFSSCCLYGGIEAPHNPPLIPCYSYSAFSYKSCKFPTSCNPFPYFHYFSSWKPICLSKLSDLVFFSALFVSATINSAFLAHKYRLLYRPSSATNKIGRQCFIYLHVHAC